MLTILNLFFWLNFLYFIVAIFFAFYLPGNFFISRYKLTGYQKTILSFLVGMVLWGWQGYVLGYLGIRWLSYAYLLFFFLAWIKNLKSDKYLVGKYISSIKRIDFWLAIIIIFGTLSQLSSVWFSGVLTEKGLYFCCGSIMDNILHIAITDQIAKNFPPFEPGMYPNLLQNYHYWSSLVIGELVRVFRLPLIPTIFQYMSLFISLFLGLSAILFFDILGLDKIFKRWLIFFLYFGGDFIWMLIAVFRGRDFFAMSPLESGQQFLENLPRAMAVIVFFCALSLFLHWIKNKKLGLGILFAFVASSLIGFKIYIGIFIFCGLGVLLIYYLFKREKNIIFPILLSVVLAAFIYIPVNSGAGGLYYTGLWRFENFVVQPYLGALNRLELARVIYTQHNNLPRIIEYELIYAGIFIFAIFGTKLIGFIQTRKSLANIPKETHLLLIPGIVVSAVVGLFYNQVSGGSNTFNFLVSIFILGSIYSAISIAHFTKNRRLIFQIFFVLLIFSLTIPRSAYQTYKNIYDISKNKGFTIKNEELKALSFLKEQKDSSGLVMVDPENKMDLNSPYLSFLTEKKMFLSGQIDELQAHNIKFSDRAKVRDVVFYGENPASVSSELLKHNIKYLYMLTTSYLVSTNSADFLEPIFYNKAAIVLRVDKKLAEEFQKKYEQIKK